MHVQIGDASYAYEIEGNGPPLLLLHGFTGRKETWVEHIQTWKSVFTCIAIDLPGHGETRTKTPRTMELYCQDLKKILVHLNIESVHLLGYSMGGRTALSFGVLYPELVTSIILESSSPGLKKVVEQKERLKQDEELAVKIVEEGLDNFITFWENIPLFKTQLSLPKAIKQKIRKERLNQTAAGLATSLRYMGTGKQPNWWGHLKDLNVPVLLLVGEEDTKFIKINQKMANLLTNQELHIIKNAGHAVHVEQSDIFGKLVTVFIKQQEKANNEGGF